jgi:hypothetical protein
MQEHQAHSPPNFIGVFVEVAVGGAPEGWRKRQRRRPREIGNSPPHAPARVVVASTSGPPGVCRHWATYTLRIRARCSKRKSGKDCGFNAASVAASFTSTWEPLAPRASWTRLRLLSGQGQGPQLCGARTLQRAIKHITWPFVRARLHLDRARAPVLPVRLRSRGHQAVERQASTASAPHVWARGVARGVHRQRLRPREVVDCRRGRSGAEATKAPAGRNQADRGTPQKRGRADGHAVLALHYHGTSGSASAPLAFVTVRNHEFPQGRNRQSRGHMFLT